MKYLLISLVLVLTACGREGDPISPSQPYTPGQPWVAPVPPPTVQLALIYKTGSTDCFVEKTVATEDMGQIYQRYCDFARPCRFSHQPGEQWEFQINTVTDPPDTTPGACDWNLPEAI